MNKWQIICLAVVLLVVGIVAVSQFGRGEAREMRLAIERHLGSVLTELESRQEGGRFPSLQAAQDALQDEVVAKRVHITSLVSTDDLYYNSTQPVVGSDALVVCARVRGELLGIQGDRKVRNLKEAELQQSHLVSFTPDGSRAEPGVPANRGQPVRSDTNRGSAAAGPGG